MLSDGAYKKSNKLKSMRVQRCAVFVDRTAEVRGSIPLSSTSHSLLHDWNVIACHEAADVA